VGSPQKFLPPDGDYPGGSTGIPLDGYVAYETGWANDGPYHGELAPMQEAGIASKTFSPQILRSGVHGKQMNFANKFARFQQKWVGSPQKFLPPDGDYPGGSTGIPLDGYVAYETGWANDGPYHGELAPMQEAGIASKGVRPQQLRFRGSKLNRKQKLGDETFGREMDEKVPAKDISRDLYAAARPRSATIDAMSDLV